MYWLCGGLIELQLGIFSSNVVTFRLRYFFSGFLLTIVAENVNANTDGVGPLFWAAVVTATVVAPVVHYNNRCSNSSNLKQRTRGSGGDGKGSLYTYRVWGLEAEGSVCLKLPWRAPYIHV
jgi:hypothetical protein